MVKSQNSRFVFGKSYNSEVKKLLSAEGSVDLAVAFVGLGAKLWLHSKKSKYRLMINLSSGGTNPKEIKKIQKLKNCSIRQLDNLHAKVLISNEVTIIGSANLSANGLGLEGSETEHWEEAGIITSTSDDKRRWFNDLWARARKISENDFKKAKEAWNKRQANRPIVAKKGSIEFLKNRGVALIVSWEHIDKEVMKAADEKFIKAKINKGLKPDKDVYAYGDYNFDSTNVYFDYWIEDHGKGKLVCYGIALPMTPKRRYGYVEYLSHDDDKIIPHKIRLKDYQRRITGLLKAYLKTIELKMDAGGMIIKLDDILNHI